MKITRKARALPLATLPLLLALGAVLPHQALAAAPVARVAVADLDLATPGGQRELDRRLHGAIEAVCVRPNAQMPSSPANRRHIETCRAAALASARLQLAHQGVMPPVRAARR